MTLLAIDVTAYKYQHKKSDLKTNFVSISGALERFYSRQIQVFRQKGKFIKLFNLVK